MSYKNSSPYERRDTDRRTPANVAGDIIVLVEVRSESRGTTTERGRSFASPLSNKDELDKGTRAAVQDAIGKHITENTPTTFRNISDPVKLNYNTSTREIRFSEYGVNYFRIIDRWFRYRARSGVSVRKEMHNGKEYIVHRKNGRFTRGGRIPVRSDDTFIEYSYNDMNTRDRYLDDAEKET